MRWNFSRLLCVRMSYFVCILNGFVIDLFSAFNETGTKIRKIHAVFTRIANSQAGGTADNNNGNTEHAQRQRRRRRPRSICVTILSVARSKQRPQREITLQFFEQIIFLYYSDIAIPAIFVSFTPLTPDAHTQIVFGFMVGVLSIVQSMLFTSVSVILFVCCSMRRHAFESQCAMCATVVHLIKVRRCDVSRA